MPYLEVPDLLYKGAKVYTLQDATTPVSPPTSTPIAPTQQGGFHGGIVTTTPTTTSSTVTTYEASKVTLDDAMFLFRKDLEYRHLVPNHQLHFDILTQNGKTYAQMVGLTAAAFKNRVNQIINLAGEDNSAATASFDVAAYAGPLKSIYANLVRLSN